MNEDRTLNTVWLFGFAYGLGFAALALSVVDMLSGDAEPSGHKAAHALMFLVGAVCLIAAMFRRRHDRRVKA